MIALSGVEKATKPRMGSCATDEAEKVAETQPDAGFLATIVGDDVLLLATAGSLVLGGGFAMLLAPSGEFLPHDIAYLGMSAGDLCSVARCGIVDFMIHDRAAFGGAVLTLGLTALWHLAPALATAASLMVGLALTFPPVTPLKSRTYPARTPRCMRALASNTPPRQFREPPGWRLARRTSREGGEPGCRGLGREEAVAAR
jgi:hypothetical protein